MQAVHIIIRPLHLLKNALGQEFQMGGQTHCVDLIGIKLHSIGIPDNIHTPLGQLQGVVRHLSVHGRAGKLQGEDVYKRQVHF